MGLITCPYNESHQIRPERMQYHLVKCKKQNPDISLTVCPYNATHLLRHLEELDHYQKCPDKVVAEIQKNRFNAAVAGNHGNLDGPLVYGSSSIPYAPVPVLQRNSGIANEENANSQKRKSQTPGSSGQLNNPSRLSSIPRTYPRDRNLQQCEQSQDLSMGNSINGYNSAFERESNCIMNSSLYLRTHGVHEENPFLHTSIRGRSPSPTPSSRSIPRIHRFGKLASSGSTVTTLRRPRIAFNPQASEWK